MSNTVTYGNPYLACDECGAIEYDLSLLARWHQGCARAGVLRLRGTLGNDAAAAPSEPETPPTPATPTDETRKDEKALAHFGHRAKLFEAFSLFRAGHSNKLGVGLAIEAFDGMRAELCGEIDVLEAELTRLRAEANRLREALESINDALLGFAGDCSPDDKASIQTKRSTELVGVVARLAQTALAEKP